MRVSSKKKQILKTMGIPIWTTHRYISGQKQRESHLPNIESDTSTDVVVDNPPSIIPVASTAFGANKNNIANDSWMVLEAEMSHCEACELSRSRKNVVNGVGNKKAKLMIIGEAPGVDEDLKGEPFIGPAGQLLNQMLFAMGCARDDVYITNLLKCSPPENRKPKVDEIQKCSSFLQRQIQLLEPKIILSVGAVSSQNILKSKEKISLLRGKLSRHEATSTPVVATFHPAYLIRKPSEKRTVWKDLLLVKKQLAITE